MKHTYFFLVCLLVSVQLTGQTKPLSNNPEDVVFHTEDIDTFWKVFDQTYPKLGGEDFQKLYIEPGSAGLKGFLHMRIENGKNLSKTVRSNLEYYQSIRESSLSIAARKDRFREIFTKLKSIYPEAVFPDVYFVIGAKNSGGTAFDGGLIVGAEMFGEEMSGMHPPLAIDDVDEIVAHELVHFQQKYEKNNTLLAQCIREGTADFICELITGSRAGSVTYAYGEAHEKELVAEFAKRMEDTNWSGWLYYSKDKSRPKDLGYWMGYKISKAYYEKAGGTPRAIHDMLNIQDFKEYFELSGYGR